MTAAPQPARVAWMLTTAGEVDGPSTYISDGWTSVSCKGPASAQLALAANASSANPSDTVAARWASSSRSATTSGSITEACARSASAWACCCASIFSRSCGTRVIGRLLVTDHEGRERSGEQHEHRCRDRELQREGIHRRLGITGATKLKVSSVLVLIPHQYRHPSRRPEPPGRPGRGCVRENTPVLSPKRANRPAIGPTRQSDPPTASEEVPHVACPIASTSARQEGVRSNPLALRCRRTPSRDAARHAGGDRRPWASRSAAVPRCRRSAALRARDAQLGHRRGTPRRRQGPRRRDLVSRVHRLLPVGATGLRRGVPPRRGR